MAKFSNLSGQQFHRLTAIEKQPSNRHGQAMWRCACECGTQKIVNATHLKAGSVKSCGCFRDEQIRAVVMTHGDSVRHVKRAPEYLVWTNMKTRCTNSNSRDYHRYGGRGIKICSRWQDGESGKSGYECFLFDMGRRPSAQHSIDRFPDNNGNYQKDNCRWATKTQQANNRRSNRVSPTIGA